MRVIIHPSRYEIGAERQNQGGDGMVDFVIARNGCDPRSLHIHGDGPIRGGDGLPTSSANGRKIRVEASADLVHPAGEAVARGEFGDLFEVAVLSAWQTPIEHARRRLADVLEAMH